MTIDTFVQTWNGKFLDVDGAYGNQCWDLAAGYARDVIGVPAPYMPTSGQTSAPAFSVLSSFLAFPNPLPAFFDRVINNTADPNQTPPAGSLVFFNQTWGSGAGHVGLKTDGSPQLVLFEQNNPVGSPCHLVSHPTSHYMTVVGWLQPKDNGGQSMQTNPNVDTGGLNTLYDAYFGRPVDASGSAAWLGKPWQLVIFNLATSPERQKRVDYLNTAIAFYEAHKNDAPSTDPALTELGHALKNYVAN